MSHKQRSGRSSHLAHETPLSPRRPPARTAGLGQSRAGARWQQEVKPAAQDVLSDAVLSWSTGEVPGWWQLMWQRWDKSQALGARLLSPGGNVWLGSTNLEWKTVQKENKPHKGTATSSVLQTLSSCSKIFVKHHQLAIWRNKMAAPDLARLGRGAAPVSHSFCQRGVSRVISFFDCVFSLNM